MAADREAIRVAVSVADMYDPDAALRAYLELREANPHLPDPQFVQPSYELAFGRNELPVLRLEVLVKIPEKWQRKEGS